jgi:hypothetical protein
MKPDQTAEFSSLRRFAFRLHYDADTGNQRQRTWKCEVNHLGSSWSFGVSAATSAATTTS